MKFTIRFLHTSYILSFSGPVNRRRVVGPFSLRQVRPIIGVSSSSLLQPIEKVSTYLASLGTLY